MASAERTVQNVIDGKPCDATAGRRTDGHGKDLSAYSLEEYTRVKHVMAATGRP